MRKRVLKNILRGVAVAIVCANALVVWVIIGPRSLDAITPYIERALTPQGSAYKVEVASSELVWDGWRHPVVIHIKHVEVMNAKGAVVAQFPEVGVHLYLTRLLIGKLSLKSLEVLHPAMVLVQKEDGTISFGFDAPSSHAPTEETALPAALAILLADENTDPLVHLRSISVRHAVLSIKRGSAGIFLQSPDASLEMTRRQGEIKGTLNMPLRIDAKNADIDAEFTVNSKDKSIALEALYTDVPSGVLHQLFPAQQWMDAVRMPLSGWAYMSSDFNLKVETLSFLMETGAGTIDYPSEFKEPLDVRHVRVEGALTDKLDTLTLKKGVVDFKDYSLTFSGMIHKQGEDYGMDVKAATNNVPLDDVQRYWPMSLFPRTRHWVTKHIGKGMVQKARVELHFKPGELKLKDTPERSIDAAIDIRGASVQYLDKQPPVTDVSGTVTFTGRSMDAEITSGKYMSGTQLKSASVRFPDFYPPDVRLFLDINLSAPAKDVVEFMSLPELDKAKALNLTRDVTGTVDGNVKFDFIAFSENAPDNASIGHINYAIAASLDNVSQDHFMGKRDVADASMKITLTNKEVKATGKAVINHVPMFIDLSTDVAHDNATTTSIRCMMPVEKLPDFGFPGLPFAKGSMGVDARFASSGASEKADATLDLTDTSVTLPEYGFVKKADERAILKASTESLGSGNTAIGSFSLEGPGITASGKGEYDAASGDFSSLTFNALRYGNHDLSLLDYARVPGGVKLVVKGRSFDASSFYRKATGKPSQKSYDLDMHADRLILAPGHELKDATVVADCAEQCRSLTIDARLPDGVKFLYGISGGMLNSTCENTGELLRVMGIFDGIEGGKMTLTGAYTTSGLEGRAIVTDYMLKKAPVLTKIFTIASLTGILDTLSGNGIAFKKLTAPFIYKDDVILLKDAKEYGPALGVTADGALDMRDSTIDIKGTLVPSYTLNSLIGNIPLIGDILMGGSGKGLIALNYSVKGGLSDPSISMNPLSALTPGFLRNIFNIFDAPAPDLEKIEADRKKLEQSKQPAAPVIAPAPAGNAPATVAPTSPLAP